MASSVDILPEFQALIKQLQTLAANLAAVEQDGGASAWLMPPRGDWNGDLTDYVAIAKLFDRSRANQQYIDITTQKTPGSQGDAQILQLMIDYTAVLQRAFLQRQTMGKARAFAHAASRRRGHGLDYGPLGITILQQLQQLVATGKSEPQQ